MTARGYLQSSCYPTQLWMALFHVSHPRWLRLVGVRTSYIHFSNISWTPGVLDPITNPFLGTSSWLHPASIGYLLFHSRITGGSTETEMMRGWLWYTRVSVWSHCFDKFRKLYYPWTSYQMSPSVSGQQCVTKQYFGGLPKRARDHFHVGLLLMILKVLFLYLRYLSANFLQVTILPHPPVHSTILSLGCFRSSS